MLWENVSYVLHDIECTVLFDTPSRPNRVQRFVGTIQCHDIGQVPLLLNPRTQRLMNPPAYATVILHPPTVADSWW